MIRITLKSDSVSTLEPGLQFSNVRGRENNEKVATVARVKDNRGVLNLVGKREDWVQSYIQDRINGIDYSFEEVKNEGDGFEDDFWVSGYNNWSNGMSFTEIVLLGWRVKKSMTLIIVHFLDHKYSFIPFLHEKYTHSPYRK